MTPDWKLSVGAEYNQSGETFDLEDEERLSVETQSRRVNGLVVRSAGEHWSYGGRSQIGSSTFDNLKLDFEAAPALEWNYFPYSMYTRRQLRVQYAIGVIYRRYYEETLYGKFEETRLGQEVSGAYEQRERWGTLVGRVEFSNFFPGLSTNRFTVDGRSERPDRPRPVAVARSLGSRGFATSCRCRNATQHPRKCCCGSAS